MRGLAATLLVGAAACGDSYIVVTVAAQPAVTGATALQVAQANAGTTHTDTLELGDHVFPVTFSLDAPGRTGELELAISATGSGGSVVGLGSAATTVDASAVTVTLDPTDFVVNTDYPNDQFLTTDQETKGYQVAATDGGPWTVAFRDTCAGACQIYARMFDPTGVPIKTEVAASTNAFTLTSAATDDQTFPAVAAANASTIAVWDFTDPTTMAQGIACRGIDASGTLTAGQLALSTDAADTVTVAPLSTGDFAVAWQTITPTVAIRTVVAHADCTPAGAVATASTIAGASDGPHRAGIADNGESVLYTWLTDDAVHVRAATPTGAFSGADTLLYASPATYQIQEARVAPMGTGFAVAVRLATSDGTTAGMIQLLRTNAAGQLLPGGPTLISDQTGADFSVGAQGFGIATRGDGATLVTWQQCDDGTPGPCAGHQDVYGRVVRPTGAPVGTPFEIPTTTADDQTSPAAAALDGAFSVAWNDSSMTPPDTQGMAVRARVIYPPFADATKVLGATCTSSADCADGLACAMHTDGARCSQTCTPPTCAGGGACTPALDPAVSACTF